MGEDIAVSNIWLVPLSIVFSQTLLSFTKTKDNRIICSSLLLGSSFINITYRTRAIITRGLYTFYPLFKVDLCTVTFGLMYG